ncbi:MAG: hypothetical protein ACRD5H_12045 [Nitrososphaerales archaeon]
MSDYPEREIGIVTLFLKHRPASSAFEIAEGTGIERIEVFYCLKVLSERNIVVQISTSPERWVLK